MSAMELESTISIACAASSSHAAKPTPRPALYHSSSTPSPSARVPYPTWDMSYAIPIAGSLNPPASIRTSSFTTR
ncbi:hypothetical protein BDU57DRAFT_362002 [Ampelomyces quisqualis]|uniref:Uncharacterized protein n=1 Tax=Ampelomyces quisqualis TaxID=50730 RepID=A0A6A5QC24_AMPQU|nr:hypothetical protein BDU57DRAFT_362002 [Ampelomyces quisqualis]